MFTVEPESARATISARPRLLFYSPMGETTSMTWWIRSLRKISRQQMGRMCMINWLKQSKMYLIQAQILSSKSTVLGMPNRNLIAISCEYYL